MHVESATLSTLHLYVIKICRTTLTPETDTSIKLYYCTHGSTCQSLGLFMVGRGTTAVWKSGLTRHEYMGETGALCNLTPLQLNLSLHYPGVAAQPQLCSVMSTVSQHSRVKCIVHAECGVKFLVLDDSRDLKFSYREIKFWKINIPRPTLSLTYLS